MNLQHGQKTRITDLRHFLPIVLLIVLAFPLAAQDLLVTETDSLNVSITYTTDENIVFLHNGKSDAIERSKVLSFTKDFYQSSKKYWLSTYDSEKRHRLRIGIHAGYSYRIPAIADGTPPAIRDYLRGLKSGYHIALDVAALFPKAFNLSIGAHYSLFSASSTLPGGAVFFTETDTLAGAMNETNFVHFVAPTVAIVSRLGGNATHLKFGFSLGYVSYVSKGTMLYDYTLTSNTWAFQFEINPDFRIYRNLYGQLRFSIFHGILRNFNYSIDGTGYSTELYARDGDSLLRMDFSAGLIFYL